MALSPEEFQRLYNSWNLNQRLDWLRFSAGLAGNPAINSQAEQDRVIRDWVRSHYGYMASYLDHPEIGPILLQSGREGWDEQRLQAAIQNTTFWKTTSESQRKWDLLTSTDPAESQSQVNKMISSIQTLLSREGVSDKYTEARIRELATTFLRNGASAEEVPQLVLADVSFDPTRPVGTMGQNAALVMQRAAEFLVPVSQETAFEWAKKLSMGTVTQDGVEEYFRQQAKARFVGLEDDIDRGFTTKQLFNPMIEQTAGLLELSAEQIDLLDSRFSAMIDSTDQHGVRRPMQLSEAARHVKGLDEYQYTRGANERAAALGETITRTFGETA